MPPGLTHSINTLKKRNSCVAALPEKFGPHTWSDARVRDIAGKWAIHKQERYDPLKWFQQAKDYTDEHPSWGSLWIEVEWWHQCCCYHCIAFVIAWTLLHPRPSSSLSTCTCLIVHNSAGFTYDSSPITSSRVHGHPMEAPICGSYLGIVPGDLPVDKPWKSPGEFPWSLSTHQVKKPMKCLLVQHVWPQNELKTPEWASCTSIQHGALLSFLHKGKAVLHGAILTRLRHPWQLWQWCSCVCTVWYNYVMWMYKYYMWPAGHAGCVHLVGKMSYVIYLNPVLTLRYYMYRILSLCLRQQ